MRILITTNKIKLCDDKDFTAAFLLIKGGNGLEEEPVVDGGMKGDAGQEEKKLGEGEAGEDGKEEEEKKLGEDEKEEDQIRSKRENGVFLGMTPPSNDLWDETLEKNVDARRAGGHKNGFEHQDTKRRVSKRVRSRRGRNRRGGTREKDWNTLPDIWMTLGKQVQNILV